MWQLLSVGARAVSRAGHKVANISDVVYLYGGYTHLQSHGEQSQLYRRVVDNNS